MKAETKTAWIKGLPTEPGVYWFDNGLRGPVAIDTPTVIKVLANGTIFFYGDYGSGPISSIYSSELCKKACHAEIEPAKTWQDYKCIKKKHSRAWVKDANGHLGFGLLEPGYISGEVDGSILWLDHPSIGEVHGQRQGQGCKFSLVQMPKLKK